MVNELPVRIKPFVPVLNYDRELSIDLETWSSVNLKTCGVYNYCAAPDFEIMLFAYKWDNEPTVCIDLMNFEDLPDDVYNALLDPRVKKKAWNAQFEITAIERHYNIKLDHRQWECSMIRAANLSLPLSLEAAAVAMSAPFQKDPAGKACIQYFCVPCKPTKANGGRVRNYPNHYPEKWRAFKAYGIRDVDVEYAISKRMDRVYFITPFERDLYCLDQKINRVGVHVDMQLVRNAIELDAEFKAAKMRELREITGLHNPNSLKQLKHWIEQEMDYDEDEKIESLRKEKIVELLKGKTPYTVQRVLRLRQLMAKTSVSKYKAMSLGVGLDGRIRGLLQFYGAARTGRWAGRLVQIHNLPKNEMNHLDEARELVLNNDSDELNFMYDNVPYVLSQLIRTAFVPQKGNRFSVLDFSAIEACVLAWIAGEKWRLDVFRNKGDIYKASASRMFNVAIEMITDELRQRGKVAELALGYGGGKGAITTMDVKKKIKEADKQPLVDFWRNANPHIVAYWRKVNDAAIRVITTGVAEDLGMGVRMSKESGIFFITLPSGRRLAYLKPYIGVNKFGGPGIFYKGADQKTSKWVDLDTYGGKLTENIIQAIARDLLAYAMVNVDYNGYTIVAHVHDEIIVEAKDNVDCLDHLSKIMTTLPTWAKGLPLNVKGFYTNYYKKD